MSKPLSEQVAELEAENDRLCAQNEALRARQGHWPTDKPDDDGHRNAGLTPLRRVHPEYISEDIDRVVADYLAGDTEAATRLIIRRDLTVHALNIAPVGSVARSDDALYSKHADGEWREPRGFKWSSETIIRRHLDAHLYTPGGA